jgi:hypothetical protein
MLRAFHLLLASAALAAAARAADLDLPPPGAFTIVVIPDTQGYRGRATKATPQSAEPLTNPVFQNHTRWITENLRAQNIVFVSHVGDIVDINNAEQWQLARECLDRLHGVVPYSLTVGNHDMTSKGDASLFQQQFPAERFRGFAWYGGTYAPDRPEPNVSANNVNSHQLFSAGGLDFIHLSLECNAPDDVLAWADGLLRQHAGRRALVTTHMDLGPIDKPKGNEGYIKDPKGRMNWVKIHGARGNSAVQMWEKLFRKHANLGRSAPVHPALRHEALGYRSYNPSRAPSASRHLHRPQLPSSHAPIPPPAVSFRTNLRRRVRRLRPGLRLEARRVPREGRACPAAPARPRGAHLER